MALNAPTVLNVPKYFEIVPNRDLSHITVNATNPFWNGDGIPIAKFELGMLAEHS
jgi:hypothetical protein